MSTVLYLVNKMITTLITVINKLFIIKNGFKTNGQKPRHDLIIALFLFFCEICNWQKYRPNECRRNTTDFFIVG